MEGDISKQARVVPRERENKRWKLGYEQKNWDIIIACEMGLHPLTEGDIVWADIKAIVIEIYSEMVCRDEGTKSSSKNGICKYEL